MTSRFDLVLNGVAVDRAGRRDHGRGQAPGVAAVYPDTLQKLQTDASPAFIGAPTIWSKLGGQDELRARA